jgi:multiple sugar transport system substrate-binding protein
LLREYKKLFLLILIVSLTSTIFLTGCSLQKTSTDEDSGGKTKISMSVWGMPWEDALYKDIYIPEFEKQNPDIDVEFHNYTKYDDKLVTLAAGGKAPDVMRQGADHLPKFLSKGMNLPLNDYIDESGIDKDDFVKTVWDIASKDGNVYGLPQDEALLTLYYDPAAFKEAGLKEPDHDYTLDQMLKDAEKLTIKNGKKVKRYGLVQAWNNFTFSNYVMAFGGSVWSEDKQTSTIDSKQAIKALEYWKKLMVDFNLTPYQSEMGQIGPDVYFQSGKAAMFIEGSWISPSVTKAAPDFKFKATSFPKGERKVVTARSVLWAVNKESKHPDAAFKLAEFLSSKEALTKYWQTLWVAPPARYSAVESKEFQNVTGFKDIPGMKPEEYKDKAAWIVDTFDNEWDTQEWIGPHQAIYEKEVDNAIQSVLVNGSKVTPKKALEKAAKNINNTIKQQQ